MSAGQLLPAIPTLHPKSLLTKGGIFLSPVRRRRSGGRHYPAIPASCCQMVAAKKTPSPEMCIRDSLYAAQYDAKYYDIVLEMCNKIMALTGSDKRELYIDPSNKLNSYANLWRKEQNHSKEYIFSLEGDYTNGARYHGVTFVNAGWGLYNTWGYFTPSKNLWDAFEEGDQRRDVTILYPGQHVKFVGRDITFGGYNTDGSVSDYTTGHVSAGLICRKFISPWEGADCKGKEVSALRDKLWNSLNCCLLRYADVMLMKAEALIWTKGEGDAEAKQLLNQIRDRAGLPQNSQATKAVSYTHLDVYKRQAGLVAAESVDDGRRRHDDRRSRCHRLRLAA